jgi:hypothetical protein
MKPLRFAGSIVVAVLVVTTMVRWVPDVAAYQRYNDGCYTCHGSFTDATSPKGTTMPSGSKHEMHRASSAMNTECALCHLTGDQRNPYTGFSDGTAINAGLGCTGCHNNFGLRRHHALNGVSECAECHDADGPPPSENVKPPYYGSIETLAANPCNATAQAATNENWSIGDYLGLDNDGDNVYDAQDTDCAVASATPGEASGTPGSLMQVTGFNASTGQIAISYGPACGATGHSIEIGPLTSTALATYAWSGRACGIGASGAAAFNPGTGSYFFVVVGNNGAAEGSYGRNSAGVERPESTLAAGCANMPQSLANRCD